MSAVSTSAAALRPAPEDGHAVSMQAASVEVVSASGARMNTAATPPRPATPPAGSPAASSTKPPAIAPPPPASAGHAKPAAPPAASSGGARRSLDDLLGTGGAASSDARSTEDDAPPPSPTPVDDPRQAELQRKLTEKEAGDAFVQAVEAMSRSAELLDAQLDPGLETQRLQEEILAKLDMLLKQPPRRSSQSSSSSSSSQPQPSPQSVPNNPSSSPSQSQSQSQSQSDAQPGDSNDGVPGGPARVDPTLEEALEGAGAEWGNLPARVRDLVRQGLRERPSGLYRRMTEDYYRRLAEESAR